MNKRDFVLAINTNEAFLIRARGPNYPSKMHCCHVARIFLLKNNEQHIVMDSALPLYHAILEDYCAKLIKALAGELTLAPEIEGNLGYFYNEHKKKSRYGIPGVNRPPIPDYNLDDYKLWRSNHNTTWLYNTSDGSIVIEVSPDYRWDLSKKHKKYLPYKAFLKNYTITWQAVVPRPQALGWLSQIIALMESMNHNVAAIRAERDSTYPQINMEETILGAIYERIPEDLTEKHKDILKEAGLARYANWWENLSEEQKRLYQQKQNTESIAIYEQMPD